jgi:uncharacterized membrane protein
MSQQQPEEGARLDEFVQRQVADAVRRRRAQQDRESSLRASSLASDLDRDRTASILNEAFAQGRLTPEEHADRTTRTFTARTLGDLDQVLTGLQTPVAAAPTHVVNKLVFWVVAFFMSPFLLMGFGLTMGGDGFGSRIFGIVLLGVLVPVLYALRRRTYGKDRDTRWSTPR